MLPLYKQFLENRGVEPNSTWLRSDDSEMYVILPDDEEKARELCTEFAVSYTNTNDDPQYIRMLRIAVNGKEGANIDVAFVPWFCGLIDKGRLTRIA